MSSSNGSGSSGMFQPIWKAAPARRNAAILALIGMAVVALAAFLPAYGRSADTVTNATLSAINMLAGTDISSSFTLFAACQTNLVLVILLEIALALGVLFPILTETELELIPAALLAGIHIYVCVNLSDIYAAADSSGIAALSELGGVSASVSILTLGFLLSLAGLAILIAAAILHIVGGSKKTSEGKESPKMNRQDEYQYDTADSLYSGNPDEETYVMDDGADQAYTDTAIDHSAADRTETIQIPTNEPAAVLKRLNTGENLPVPEGDTVIGRNAGKAQIVVSSAAVSGAHARISAYRGSCSVTDLNSTNGTYINGVKLEPNIRAELRDGDYLSLGAEILEFHMM